MSSELYGNDKTACGCFMSIVIFLLVFLATLTVGFNAWIFTICLYLVFQVSLIYFQSEYRRKFEILYVVFVILFVVSSWIISDSEINSSLGSCINKIDRNELREVMMLHDINRPIDEKENTLLHYVAQEKDIDLYNSFYDKGADETIKNVDGITPRDIIKNDDKNLN